MIKVIKVLKKILSIKPLKPLKPIVVIRAIGGKVLDTKAYLFTNVKGEMKMYISFWCTLSKAFEFRTVQAISLVNHPKTVGVGYDQAS